MRIRFEKIEETLSKLDKKYNEEFEKQDIDNFQLSIYCKIAALELCGWLEETYDQLIKDLLNFKELSSDDIKEFENLYIKKVHGLSYKNHLRMLIINALGFAFIKNLEKQIPNEIQSLQSILEELHKYRNYLAHNQYIDYSATNPVDQQKNIDTPGLLKDKLKKIVSILDKIIELSS